MESYAKAREKMLRVFFFLSLFQTRLKVILESINDACFPVVTSEIKDCNNCKNCRILINVLFQQSSVFRYMPLPEISEKELNTFFNSEKYINRYNL